MPLISRPARLRLTPRLPHLPTPVAQLSGKCAKRVAEEEEEEARDWRIDPGLHRACEKDTGAGVVGSGGEGGYASCCCN